MYIHIYLLFKIKLFKLQFHFKFIFLSKAITICETHKLEDYLQMLKCKKRLPVLSEIILENSTIFLFCLHFFFLIITNNFKGIFFSSSSGWVKKYVHFCLNQRKILSCGLFVLKVISPLPIICQFDNRGVFVKISKCKTRHPAVLLRRTRSAVFCWQNCKLKEMPWVCWQDLRINTLWYFLCVFLYKKKTLIIKN